MLVELFCPRCHQSAGYRDSAATVEFPPCEKCGKPTQFVAGWTEQQAKLLTADAHLMPTTEESRDAQVTAEPLTYRQRCGQRKTDGD